MSDSRLYEAINKWSFEISKFIWIQFWIQLLKFLLPTIGSTLFSPVESIPIIQQFLSSEVQTENDSLHLDILHNL